jgi:hypothetical protein
MVFKCEKPSQYHNGLSFKYRAHKHSKIAVISNKMKDVGMHWSWLYTNSTGYSYPPYMCTLNVSLEPKKPEMKAKL